MMFSDADIPEDLLPIFCGPHSVMLFFVLSGYVLSLPYWARAQLTYGRYLTRRMCRIFIPYAVAVLLSAVIGAHLTERSLPLTDWFYKTWHTPITTKPSG